MSFSSRRRNYLLTPHRRDGLIEWMKSMLQHSFVLDALETTGADTFSHFEVLIDEHRLLTEESNDSLTPVQPSRLMQLVPTIGKFHTHLPLRRAFEIYNEKHQLTKRKHIQISFNELRHILNLAQIIALRKLDDAETGGAIGKSLIPTDVSSEDKEDEFSSDGLDLNPPVDFDTNNDSAASIVFRGPPLSTTEPGEKNTVIAPPDQLNGPRLISFDGDQTLYSDGANFEGNPRLANYLYQLLRHGVTVAVVTAAGYEYNVDKYQYRLSGLLTYFKQRGGLSKAECERFYLFGGECNYLLQLGNDFILHPVREHGPGGWMTSTRYLPESPANWPQSAVQDLLDTAEAALTKTQEEMKLRGRIIRKKRSIGLIPSNGRMTRESLDEAVLRMHEVLSKMNKGAGPGLPYCAFNGGSDAWIDVGNKRVGVQILQSYLGIPAKETLHIGDQFLNTGNDYAARDVSPCIWIIDPQETTYILKSILRLAGVPIALPSTDQKKQSTDSDSDDDGMPDTRTPSSINFEEIERRTMAAKRMDVYTGEMINPAI